MSDRSEKSPRVSVIVPCYNGERFIGAAIESVLGQTYTDFEIIVVDDGSADGSADVVGGYLDDGRVKLVRHEANQGIPAARNTGVRNSSGEYLAFLDQDDCWVPEKLVSQVEIMDARPEVGMVFSDMMMVDDDGARLGLAQGSAIPSRFNEMSRDERLRALFLRNFIPFISVFLKRSCLDKVGWFDESILGGMDDYELCLRLVPNCEVVAMRGALAAHTVHPGGHSRDIRRLTSDAMTVMERVLAAHPSLEDLRARRLSIYHLFLARHYRDELKTASALREAGRAVAADALWLRPYVFAILCLAGGPGRWILGTRRRQLRRKVSETEREPGGRDRVVADSRTDRPNWMPKILKESGISLIGSVVGTGLNYAVLLVVTRYLAPEQFGTFALAQSIIAVSLVFVLWGTPRALDRFIPHFLVRNEPGRVRELLSRILGLVSWLALAVTVALIALSRTLAMDIFDSPDLIPILRLMALSVPALAWIDLVASSFAGFKELRYRVYTHQLALPLLKISIAAVVLWLGYGLCGWVWAYLGALVVTSLLALWFFRRRIWSSVGVVPRAAVDLRRVVSYCWPLSVNNLVIMLYGNVGVLLLGAFRPEAEVGVYRVYIYVVLMLVLVKTSFSQIYKPVAAEVISVGDRSNILELHRRVSKWMLIISLLFSLGMFLLGLDVLALLLPGEYMQAPAALLILIAARALAAAIGLQGMTLEAYGNTRLSMLNALLLLGVNVGLGRLLIPTHGVLGAAVALAAAIAVATVAELAEVYIIHRVHPFSGAYFRGLVVGVVVGAGVYLVRQLWCPPGPLGIVACGVALTLLYALGLRVSGTLDSEDYALLRRMRTRLTRRE